MSKNIDYLDKFFVYVETINIQLLKGDKDWLRDLVFRRNTNTMRLLLRQYIEIWLAELEKEDNQNKARYAANTYIRIAILGS